MQTNQFAGAVSAILGIVHQYMDQRMNEAVKVAVQIQSDSLRDEAQRENEEFLKTVDENMQKIIKEQVKEHVKTSYAVAADLSEIELKKILIEKMEGNKSIQRSDEQRNLYKALDEEPSAGPDLGSKRRKEGKEPESASALTETVIKSAGRSTKGSKSRHVLVIESAFTEEPMQTNSQMEEPSYLEFDTGSEDQPIVQYSQHPDGFLNHRNHHLRIMIGIKLCQLSTEAFNSRRVIPFEHFINNDLEYLRGGASSRKYTTSITKTKAADYGHIKWIKDLVPKTMWIEEPIGYDKHTLWGVSHWGRKRQQFYSFAVNPESARNVYSKRRIIAVNELKIVEWHSYKHLDWITMRRDDDKLYKLKEGDFKRQRIQDIEDMLLLLVQGKLTNLTVKERFAFNVSL
uniref:Uncharacterized protein n=1 Tax=Tanacetum cinerariifolium TaxID=118510 RepID=A0A699L3G0_TANCI|nr:hypothetical protein [Tanacetum cinerariifolium]